MTAWLLVAGVLLNFPPSLNAGSPSPPTHPITSGAVDPILPSNPKASGAVAAPNPAGTTGFGPSGVWSAPGVSSALARLTVPPTSLPPPVTSIHPYCAALAPGLGGRAALVDGCYAHDEAGIQFYSTLAGSGGNVSWDVTLPVDRDTTHNQSDLYTAAWFGMVLTDPHGWLDQCFLELQFYPDQSWTNGLGFPGTSETANGHWIGAAVGWQVDTATGAEDPCFYEPLYVSGRPGAGELNMTQGDRLSVRMTGWVGNPAGENLTITDLSRAQTSYVQLFNSTGNYPLDPAYATNAFEQALPWTSGGEYPIVFAFELGKSGNPSYPSRNAYGGCSPGPSPAGTNNPSTPCPSYDPSSWVNDTLHPWGLSVPTFFNAASSVTPAQVALTSNVGGIGSVFNASNGTCANRIGSGGCGYPWFSYSCGAQAFEFGATDYPETTSDFGMYNQFSTTSELDAAGLPFFPPTNFSVPTCDRPAYSVTVGTTGAGSGSVYFLSNVWTAPATLSGLAPGDYSISALPGPGESFEAWVVSGSVTVPALTSPWTTVHMAGSGTLSAAFAPSVARVAVLFSDNPSGSISVSSGFLSHPSSPPVNVPSGSSLQLVPGFYTLVAWPNAGASFLRWTISGPGLDISSPRSPYASMEVTGAQGSVALTAQETIPQGAADTFQIAAVNAANGTFDGGTVVLAGVVTTSTQTVTTLVVGTYSLNATPSAGFVFVGWVYTWSGMINDFRAATNITLENGTHAPAHAAGLIWAIFLGLAVATTFAIAPAQGGEIGIRGLGISGTAFERNGSTVLLFPGASYTIFAIPAQNYSFVDWNVNDATAAWSRNPGSWVDSVLVNSTVQIAVNYTLGTAFSVGFAVSPMGDGYIEFNGLTNYTNAAVNRSVTGGSHYLIRGVPSAGFAFRGWLVTGGVSAVSSAVAGSYVAVIGNGSVTALFSPTTYPVSFVANTPVGSSFRVDSSTLGPSGTVNLLPGNHVIALVTSGNRSFIGWSTTPGLSVNLTSSANATLTVQGPGTVYALVASFRAGPISASPNPLDLGGSTVISVATSPSGAFNYGWSGLPVGCVGVDGPSLTCTPALAGSSIVTVKITNTTGESVSESASVVVNPLPTVATFGFSPSALDVGIPTVVSVTVTGGTGPFGFAYSALPAGCTSNSVATFSCTPTATGTFVVNVTATDIFARQTRGTATLLVNALPSLQAVLGPGPSVTVNTLVTIQTTVSFGTGPFTYAYSGLPPGCTSSNSASLSCQPTSSGTWNITVRATDSFGKQASQMLPLTVTANPGVRTATSSTSYIIAGLIALAVAAAAAFLILRRRGAGPRAAASSLYPPIAPAVGLPPPARPPPTPIPEWEERTEPTKDEWRED